MHLPPVALLPLRRPAARLLVLLLLGSVLGDALPVQASVAASRTYYVSTSGFDSGPGTSPAPFLTIQRGINAAKEGDTVLVEDGTYTGPGDVDLNLGAYNITVTSQHGAAKTIINCGGFASTDGSGEHTGFTVNNAGVSKDVINGFTVENGYSTYGTGGAITLLAVGATVQNCIIKNNTAGQGGGIYNDSEDSTGTYLITVTNCLFTGNTATTSGGGIYNANYGGTISVTGCTFTQNTAPGGSGGGVYNVNEDKISLTNDILYSDNGGEIANNPNNATMPTAAHCDVEGGIPSDTTNNGGNFDAFPQFVNAGIGDYHLMLASPCAGKGTSSAFGFLPYALDGQPRPIPPSIGAFEVRSPRLVFTNISLSRSGGVVTVMAKIQNYGDSTATGVHVTQAKLAGVAAHGPLPGLYDIAPGGVQDITLTFTTSATGRKPFYILGTSGGLYFSTGQFLSVP